MRFRQLLILIVLCAIALLTSAQTGPNYHATGTAIAEMTSGTHIQATRNFLTPAEYHLTVTAAAIDASDTASALSTRTPIATMQAQSLTGEEFDMTSTAMAAPETTSEASNGSTLVIALLFFGGVLAALGILGGLFFMMSKGEKGR